MISRVCCSAQALCFAFAMLLAACGGGGGSSAPDPSTASGLTVSPSSISFTAVQNGAIPPTQNIQITVSHPNFAIIVAGFPTGVTPPTWLDKDPSRFTGGGNNWTLTAAILTASMDPGTYTTTLRVAIGDASHNLLAYRDVQVSYTVQPQTGLAGNPQSLAFGQLKGAAAPTAQNLGISDIGNASYGWNASIIYQSGTGWLNINGAASASGATLPTSLSVSVNASGALGTLNALVRVTGNGNTLDVPVSYTVSEPQLTRSPAQLTFNAPSQGTSPVAQDVTLSTQSSLPVNYTTNVTYDAGVTGWLSVPGSGTAPGTVSVGVSTTNLAPGTYTATLTFNTAAQSVSVAVTYNIATSSLTLSPSPASFTVTPASLASALSQSVSVGSTGAPLTWTAVSSQPWVTVSPPSGPSGSSLTLNLVPAELDPLEAGSRSATVTFSYTPPNASATSAPLTVNLNLQLPKVNYVSPYVELPNTSTEVILRGSGFSNATGLNVMFGATPVSFFTQVSDTEIRVSHPSLAAGSYLVTIPNQLNLTRSRASLVVATPPTFTAVALATSLIRDRTIYDAERVSVYTNNWIAGSVGGAVRVERHHWNGSAWDTDFKLLNGPPRDIAATPDGRELIALSPSTLYHIDLDTWTISNQIDISTLPFPFNQSSFSRIAMSNDGNALVYVGTSFITPFRYNVLTRALVEVPSPQGGLYGGITPVSSMDGSRILVGQNGISPPLKLYYFDTSLSQFVQALPDLTVNRMTYDRTGSNSIIDGTVFDRQFQTLGSAPINLSHSAISPDGTRGYGVDPDAPTVLHTYDLASPNGSGFTELAPITLPDSPGEQIVLGVTPDGKTVFISGDARFIVQPVP